MTSTLAGIHATIAACFNCGLDDEKIVYKLVNKYEVPYAVARSLVEATRALVGHL